MRGDLDFAFGGDEFEYLVGDDFDCVTLCLDLHFSFGGEGGQAFALGKQADAFANAGAQAFAHCHVGVLRGCEGDVLVACEVEAVFGG